MPPFLSFTRDSVMAVKESAAVHLHIRGRGVLFAFHNQLVLAQLDSLVLAAAACRAARRVCGHREMTEHKITTDDLAGEALEEAVEARTCRRARDSAPLALWRTALEALGEAVRAWACRWARDSAPLALWRAALEALGATSRAVGDAVVAALRRARDVAARALRRAARASAARAEVAQLAALAVADARRVGTLAADDLARRARDGGARKVRIDHVVDARAEERTWRADAARVH